jgi:hypothetical protein
VDFSRRIYGYCERGFSAGPGADAFWAEPLNALTNAAFIIAAVIALVLAIRTRRLDGPVIWLTTLTFAVGIGSFLFHTYAVVWAAMTDTIPILIFILSYFAISMRCYGGFGWGKSLGLVLAFLVMLVATSTLLRFGLGAPGLAMEALTSDRPTYLREAGGVIAVLVAVPVAAYAIARALIGASALKTLFILALWAVGTMAFSALASALIPEIFPGMRSYFPALMALIVIGAWLHGRDHPAGAWLLMVAAVFAISLTFRAIDRPLCAHFLIGTHWLWHVLNGVVLGSLLVALIRHGRRNPA